MQVVHSPGGFTGTGGRRAKLVGVLSFACPRCAAEVGEEYYGPCTTCRADLRATQGTDPAGFSSETAYEPKMNVTPNAVALKE